MRILEVTNFMPPHPGGIERVAESLMRELSLRGHQVEWIASANPEQPGREGQLVRVPAWNWLESNLHVPMPIWTPGALRELLARVRWADVVHFHDCLYMSSSAAVAVSVALSKPLLCTQHIAEVPYGGMLDVIQRIAYRTLGRVVLGMADEIATYSPHVVDYFRQIGVVTPLKLIPLGFEERFAPLTPSARAKARALLGLGEHDQVILFAARLVPKKGVDVVAKVQRRLAESGVRLLVAGDGPLADQLEAVPGTLLLREVPHSRMHELYGMSDVLLLPSRGEGLPLTLQEGMLTGLPAVVSTDPSFVVNLQGAPGVTMTDELDSLVEAVRSAMVPRPGVRDSIVEWSRAHWGLGPFVDAYEEALVRIFKNAQASEGARVERR